VFDEVESGLILGRGRARLEETAHRHHPRPCFRVLALGVSIQGRVQGEGIRSSGFTAYGLGWSARVRV
jgi:hypothetical protein